MRGLQERLQLMLEGTETGFWEWDVSSDRIEWSNNVGPLHGLAHGAQPGGFEDYLATCVAEDQRDELRALVRAAVEDGVPYTHDTRITLPGGGERWLSSRVQI